MYLIKTLRELQKLPIDQLLQQRYERFRQMGPYLEAADAESAPA
jgi:acetyl-CoA carboxylase carboxyl transferase subunit alpha